MNAGVTDQGVEVFAGSLCVHGVRIANLYLDAFVGIVCFDLMQDFIKASPLLILCYPAFKAL